MRNVCVYAEIDPSDVLDELRDDEKIVIHKRLSKELNMKNITHDASFDIVDYLSALDNYKLKKILCNLFKITYVDEAALREKLEPIIKS